MNEQIVQAQHQQDVARRYLRAVETWDAAVERNKNAETARTGETAQPRAKERLPHEPRAVSALSGRCGGVARYFSDVLAWAMAKVWGESTCRPGVVNWREQCAPGAHAWGLMQICLPLNQSWFDAVGCNAPLDADCNMRAARHGYDIAGRGPWGG